MVTDRLSALFKRRSLWLALALVVAAGSVSVLALRSVLQSRQAAQEAAAMPPPQRVSVAALGRIEPESRVLDVAASENGIIREIRVKVGDPVMAGQVLMVLDTYDVRKAERDYAEGQLIEAQKRLGAATRVGDARIQEANTRAAQARQPRTEAIRAQAATIRSLQAQLELAQIDLARNQDLFNQGAVARQALDRQQTEVDRMRNELGSAIATQAQLEAAQATELNTAAAQISAAAADQQLSQVETGVETAARNLALAEARLALAVVTAPVAGQILDIYVDPGEATAGQRLLSMGNTASMYVVAEVYETDVGLVKPGQRATITSRNGAFSETLTGTVEQIGLQIFKNDVLDDDPAANADARVVEVRIAIDQDAVVQPLTNLQVDVQIDIKS